MQLHPAAAAERPSGRWKLPPTAQNVRRELNGGGEIVSGTRSYKSAEPFC